MAQREEVLSAFVAKYGWQPEEVVQVMRIDPNGSVEWYVRRREKEKPESPLFFYDLRIGTKFRVVETEDTTYSEWNCGGVRRVPRWPGVLTKVSEVEAKRGDGTSVLLSAIPVVPM
jgi:hypothetical protein